MSVVTNLILHFSILEDEENKIHEVNKYFEGGQKELVSMDSRELPRGWYGGRKMLEAVLFVGAFNYLGLDDFLVHLKSIKWEYPKEVQVIIKEQGKSVFRIMGIVS